MKPPALHREERPWGEFVEFTRNTPSTVKIIIVRAGEALSLQRHANRDELWYVISGNGTITIGTDVVSAVPQQTYSVPRTTNHRIEGGTEPLVILEVSTGDFDEADIIRLEDKYGRN